MDYIKLKDLQEFTVHKVNGFTWKKWDQEAKKMLVSETREKDFRKMYQVETDQGILDLSQSQLASMLEGFCKNGVSDINGKSFSVRTNGKTGMDIRYFINPIYKKAGYSEEKPTYNYPEDNIDISEVPF